MPDVRGARSPDAVYGNQLLAGATLRGPISQVGGLSVLRNSQAHQLPVSLAMLAAIRRVSSRVSG